MDGNFFQRLQTYYLSVAAVLRGEAEVASIFPNATDIGMSRERVYVEFLRQHAPSKCNVFLGGFLFGEDGSESRQLDIIVTTDTTPRFDFCNNNNNGKSFAPVEGTLAVASIKSTLDKKELVDALTGIASIPPTSTLNGRVNPNLPITNYDDWPYKIIYASSGIAPSTLLDHLTSYYAVHPDIPLGRRPNIIHVSGKYIISRATPGMSGRNPDRSGMRLDVGRFYCFDFNADLQGILWVLQELQVRATLSTHILYSYSSMINRIFSLKDASSE